LLSALVVLTDKVVSSIAAKKYVYAQFFLFKFLLRFIGLKNIFTEDQIGSLTLHIL
jgi:hypothetical protein